MAPFVHLLVIGDFFGPTGVGRDDRQSAALVQLDTQAVAVERLIADECAERDAAKQRLRGEAVMALPGQEDEACEVAERIDERHELGGQAAARFADCPILGPPLRRWRAGGPSRWCRRRGRTRNRGLPTTP